MQDPPHSSQLTPSLAILEEGADDALAPPSSSQAAPHTAESAGDLMRAKQEAQRRREALKLVPAAVAVRPTSLPSFPRALTASRAGRQQQGLRRRSQPSWPRPPLRLQGRSCRPRRSCFQAGGRVHVRLFFALFTLPLKTDKSLLRDAVGPTRTSARGSRPRWRTASRSS